MNYYCLSHYPYLPHGVINIIKTCTYIPLFVQVFVQKVVPDTDTLILRLASRYLKPMQQYFAVVDPGMFLGLPDPVLLVRGTDPDPDSSIIKQKQ